MKLNKTIKDKIDNYFDNISAEELYEISVKNYGFTEDISFEINSEVLSNVNVDVYISSTDERYEANDNNNLPLAA